MNLQNYGIKIFSKSGKEKEKRRKERMLNVEGKMGKDWKGQEKMKNKE